MKIEEEIVEFSKVNFNKIYIKAFLQAFFLGLVGSIIAYLLSNTNDQFYIERNKFLVLTPLLLIPLIGLLQSLIYIKIYIYTIVLRDGLIEIRWQDRSKENLAIGKIENFQFEVIPSGKDDPYLSIEGKTLDGRKINIRQRTFEKWTKEIMADLVEKADLGKKY